MFNLKGMTMLRAVLYGLLLGGALVLSAWMGMSDGRTAAKRSVLRITMPVKLVPAEKQAENIS